MKKILLLCFIAVSLMNCQRPDVCANGFKDGNEVDIDCGGRCGECPNCLDGIQNYQELGVDCGSNCKPCKNTWQILPPNFNTFESNWLVDFTSETNGVMVSLYSRQIYTTKNGGETWDPGYLPPYPGTTEGYAQMTKLYMANDNLGFLMEKVEPAISPESYLYRTTDGGTTWQLVANPTDKDVAFYEDIVMVDDQLGFLSLFEYDNGQFGQTQIFRTRDGGQTWSLRCRGDQFQTEILSNSLPFVEIVAFGKELIRAYTYNGIIESRDEGTSWTVFTQNEFRPRKIQMLNEDIGFATKESFWGQYDIRLFKTVNGGKDWFPITQDTDERFATHGLRGFHFTSPDKGFLIPDGGTVNSPGYVTKDGGATYEDIGQIDVFYFRNVLTDNMYISSADFVDDNLLYCIGNRGHLFKLKYED